MTKLPSTALRLSLRATLLGLALGAATLPSCEDEVVAPAFIAVDRSPGCHPLGAADLVDGLTSPATCLFPYPSFWNEAEDADSPTGVRVAIPAERLPFAGPALDPTSFNKADGFSPVTPILVHFARDVDTSALAGIHSAERSLAADAAVQLIDLETGKHVLHFVEMDMNRRDDYPDRYAFIVRPIEPMEMGHRHGVFLKTGLTDLEGAAIPATPAFQALRDGTRTDNPDVEGVRAHMEGLFARGEELGLKRADLLLAFDFQVASKDWLLGPVTHMRDEALKAIAQGEVGYTIENVEVDPNPDIAKIVYGTFEVPTFLDADDRMVWDERHVPLRQPSKSYPFTMLVPKRAETEGPLPLVVLGHGIFGNGRDFLTGGSDGAAIQVLANQFGAIVIASDWIGLSTHDLPRIANEVAVDLNHINLITDQLQQALINAITETKLALGPLAEDPQAQVANNPLTDPGRIYYWGASLGGIEGSSFVSLSPDIQRAVFGVPGSAWSTMLTRSIVFPPIKTFVEVDFPDPLDQQLLMTMAQTHFDHSDPANVTRLMFKEPLPDAPPDRLVALQESIGDSQVPNLATDILARAMGIKLMTPAFYAPYGLQEVTGPTTESCLTQFRMDGWDMPEPPDENIPPDAENNVHHDMNFLPKAHEQIASIFFSGVVSMPCEDSCDPD